MPRILPLAFDGCAGHLTLPAGERAATGIVLCRSWGIDELCTRKFLRCLSDDLAEKGFPVLRFDYPGTADSLDGPQGTDFEDWTDAAHAACDLLNTAAGCRDVVLFGLGPGALVAARTAARRQDVAGLVLAAPVASGRRFLREIGIGAQILREGLGLPPDDAAAAGQVTIGGLALPDGVAASLGGVSLAADAFARPLPCLVVAREAAGDDVLARQLEGAGHAVTLLSFAGYAGLMKNPTESELPQPVVAAISGWVARTFAGSARSGPLALPALSARLAGDGFVEEGVVFRAGAPLFGILCRPDTPSAEARPVAVFLNSGYDHHGGWARCWVTAARSLARQGIASLRFDLSNVGDSPAKPGEPEQVLYTQGPVGDVSDALDYLETACPGLPVVIGRCSGAYTALHAARRDRRIAAIGLINQLRLVWDPDESLADALTTAPRSVGEYRRRLFDPKTVRRLLAGEIDLRAVLRSAGRLAATRLSHALAPVFPNMSRHARLRAECHGIFADLDRRGVRVAILCSERDESLEQLSLYFGRDRRGLRRFGRVGVDTVADADHNLTPPAAQQALRRWLHALVTADVPPLARRR